MGGFMAADVAAAEPHVAGLFLIDPWDPSETAAALSTPEGGAAWQAAVARDLPHLHGATYASLPQEITADTEKFDLRRKLVAYARLPLALIGAERGKVGRAGGRERVCQ